MTVSRSISCSVIVTVVSSLTFDIIMFGPHMPFMLVLFGLSQEFKVQLAVLLTWCVAYEVSLLQLCFGVCSCRRGLWVCDHVEKSSCWWCISTFTSTSVSTQHWSILPAGSLS